MNIQETIEQIRTEFTEKLQSAKTKEDIEKLRIEFLGRKGKIPELMTTFKNLPENDRKTFGPIIQKLRSDLESVFAKATPDKQESKMQNKSFFDVTTSLASELKGTKHIFSQVIEELEDIFVSMGYDIVHGNEVEDAYYNFTALNIPENHPAREMTDTFWLHNPGMLLRTHTSSVQAHVMKQGKLPLAIFSSGRCYRNEKTDATHDFMFMQYECMFIDKEVSISNLLATAQTFLRALFKRDDLNIRVRPGYFPFVEPGLELDATCPFCKEGLSAIALAKEECAFCKKTGWIEMFGAGLIHPNVLKMSGIDETKYTGFALGGGIERLIMLRHGISDIRLFRNNKIAFLDQF